MSRASTRVSLSTFLGSCTFLAIACGVVITGSPAWETAYQLCFLLSLGWALVLTISAAGSRRCFWTGYLVFAVLYYAATYNKLDWLGIERKELLTLALVEDCVERLHPRVDTGSGWDFPDEGKLALRAAHRTVAIVFGCIAGILAMFVRNQQSATTR